MALFSEEIADGVRRRDPEAITTVYTALADRLFGYLMARVHNKEIAEDLLEATFVELLEKGFTIRGESAVIKSWLFRAAHFNALDHLRRVRRAPEEYREDPAEFDEPDIRPGPEELAVDADISRELFDAIKELSEDQQEVLLLRYVGELTAPEVASVVGKKVPAVRGLQHRGERSLARLLDQRSDAMAASATTGRASQDRDPVPD